MSKDMSPELRIALEAAKIGSETAMEYFEKDIPVSKKQDGSVLTEIDSITEEAIKKFILQNDKNAQFIAEESEEASSEDTFWTIDPIDGTRAFTHKTPFWCVLISYFRNGKPVVGVCNFPLLGGSLYAEVGKGAYLEGKPVHVSQVKELSDALISFGSMKRFKDKSKIMELIDIAASTRSPEPTYSCYLIAQGKVDVCVDEYGYIWDRAPFQVIIPEAGGKISNPQGKELQVNDKGYIVTNGFLQDEVVKIYTS